MKWEGKRSEVENIVLVVTWKFERQLQQAWPWDSIDPQPWLRQHVVNLFFAYRMYELLAGNSTTRGKNCVIFLGLSCSGRCLIDLGKGSKCQAAAKGLLIPKCASKNSLQRNSDQFLEDTAPSKIDSGFELVSMSSSCLWTDPSFWEWNWKSAGIGSLNLRSVNLMLLGFLIFEERLPNILPFVFLCVLCSETWFKAVLELRTATREQIWTITQNSV